VVPIFKTAIFDAADEVSNVMPDCNKELCLEKVIAEEPAVSNDVPPVTVIVSDAARPTVVVIVEFVTDDVGGELALIVKTKIPVLDPLSVTVRVS
jgi:hypothetical protein